MTFLSMPAVLLFLVLAACLWIGAPGQVDRVTDGRVSEGRALEAFFNSTLPGSNFQQTRPCVWNATLVGCDGESMKVVSLNLSGLGLAGPIPPGTISNLTGLEHLDLSYNRLNGSLPAIGQLENLTDLYLGGNRFTGPLDDSNFSPNLVNIDLTGNSLQGPFPDSLTNLSDLRSLKLGSNSLGGNVTDLIVSLKSVASLMVLDLSSNNFSGEIFPLDFGPFQNLTTLNLRNNGFSKHSFPTLPNAGLENLSLASTNLSGKIPGSISGIVTLMILDLSDNDLHGKVPTNIGNLNKLLELDLSRNNLSGELPFSMENMTFLSHFNVSYNGLSGRVPTGHQFNTFSSDSFLGNPELCGFPLSNECPFQAPAPSAVNETTSGGKSSVSIGAILGGVAGGVVFVLFVVVALFFWCRHSRAVKPLARDETRHVSGPMQYEKDAETWATGVASPGCISVHMFEKPLLNLSFSDLMKATRNFSKEMQIADGGYGPVYKGILQDGTQLAVKVLVDVGFLDEKNAAEKIEGLCKVKHPNLVSLIGYCLVGEDSILIYEYMVHGDLQRWLHDRSEDTARSEDWTRDKWDNSDGFEDTGEYLSWPTRHKIALGIARALAFLHHGCSPHIIHRDVKSSNIVLDDSFEPHLVDSGLAGIARVNGTPIIGGTLGYVPPEYGQTWQATTRGDVYSFGVVLLELVTGRKPTGQYFHDSYGGNLVGWVRSMIKQDKRGQKALDPKLVSRGHVPEMLEVLRIGYLCTADTPAKRPTMQQVVGLLKDLQSVPIS